jgi:hypothetical protein
MRAIGGCKVSNRIAVFAVVSLATLVSASLAAGYVAPREPVIQAEHVNSAIDRSKKGDRLKIGSPPGAVQNIGGKRPDLRGSIIKFATSELTQSCMKA